MSTTTEIEIEINGKDYVLKRKGVEDETPCELCVFVNGLGCLRNIASQICSDADMEVGYRSHYWVKK